MKRAIVLSLWAATVLRPSANASEPVVVPTPKRIEVTAPHKMALLDIQTRISPETGVENSESYTLEAKKKKVYITAKSEQAAVWARETLGQLVDSKGLIPFVRITDWPSQAVRPVRLDSHSMIPVDTIKRQIYRVSTCKLNTFYWRLATPEAWRIESRLHPRLNEAEYSRDGFYTIWEIESIIAFGKERGVKVIPEIVQSDDWIDFRRAFGFGIESERGQEVLKDCLEELKELIPVLQEPDAIRLTHSDSETDQEEVFVITGSDADNWPELKDFARKAWE